MLIRAISQLLVSVVSLGTIAAAQSPQDLPLDDGTRRFLEALSPEKQADILREFGKAIAGQVPASPDMTLDEKVSVTSGQTTTPNGCNGMIPGVPRLGFPGVCVNDGPSGLHGVEAVDGYAAGVTVAAAWNRDLAHARGRHMGLEAKRRGVNNLLGPTVGPLGRTVLGGRNWESFSVDPYLCGVMGNRRNPSSFGMGNASLTANFDDRTMHELYLWPFQDLVKAGVGSVMCSYNRINGSHGCQNSYTQNGLLKTELGFQGFVITDAGALHSGVSSANAGADITTHFNVMWGGNLTAAIANGTIEESRLDDMVTRIVASWFKYGEFEPGTGIPVDVSKPHKVVSSISRESRKTIFQGAVKGIILVKNHNNTLPLKKPKVLSLFGYDADVPRTNNREGPQVLGLTISVGQVPGGAHLGTLITGGGSASITPAYINSPYSAFQQRVMQDGTFLYWDFESQDPVYANAGSDACIVFINEFSTEGSERSTLADPWSDQLVKNVAAKCPNSPSGRLPYTVAKNESEYGELLMPVTADNASNYYTLTNFTEGVYIDYRRFDAFNITPRYEFGFGLSYTTFGYSGLYLELTSAGTNSLWDVIAIASADVKNTGSVAASAIPQLYVGIPKAPVKQLRGFDKVFLKPGEVKRVTFSLTRRDLSTWDVEKQNWVLGKGGYNFYAGASSRALPLTDKLVL
ncbi:glycoside hydrolase family 3 protein [Fusarium bulbicola]|nr:glycoside hydrolase family 3 protein [Fusarium bulbicola]